MCIKCDSTWHMMIRICSIGFYSIYTMSLQIHILYRTVYALTLCTHEISDLQSCTMIHHMPEGATQIEGKSGKPPVATKWMLTQLTATGYKFFKHLYRKQRFLQFSEIELQDTSYGVDVLPIYHIQQWILSYKMSCIWSKGCFICAIVLPLML